MSTFRQQRGRDHQSIDKIVTSGRCEADHTGRRPLLRQARRAGEGCLLMADLAYALVFVGIFLVLALTLRGLEYL